MKKKNIKKRIVITSVILLIFVLGAFLFLQEAKETPTEKEVVEEEEEEVAEDLEIIVYFFRVVDGEEELVKVEREIPFTYEIAIASIGELLKGPSAQEKEEGISTAINEDVELQSRSINLDTNTAFVDFSEELQEDVAGSAQVTMIRDQIEKTLQQFDNIDEAVISIDGETEDILQP